MLHYITMRALVRRGAGKDVEHATAKDFGINATGELNMPKRLPLEFFHLRVLLSWVGNICEAQCLETGSIITADNANTARSMIMEVLRDEVRYAQDNSNLSNLFSTPASLGTWQTYYEWQDVRAPKELGRGVKILCLPKPKVASAGRRDTNDT